MKILKYDTAQYNFAELVGDLFPVDLAELDNERHSHLVSSCFL